MRLVFVATAALIYWGETVVPLGAAEAVRLPMYCSYIANKVVLVPSLKEEVHVIVGDRDHKTIRVCAPGLLSKCRNWEVHRFDVLCGGRQVSWRQVAGQLLNLASASPKKEGLFRVHLEPWEARILLAETEFAPVDEFGGRILPFMDGPVPPPVAVRDTADARPAAATEPVTPPPGPGRSDPDSAPPKLDPPRVPEAPQAAAIPQQAPAVNAPQSVMPPASGDVRAMSQGPDERPNSATPVPPPEGGDGKAANAVTGPSNPKVVTAEFPVPDAQLSDKAETPPSKGVIDLLLASVLLGIGLLAIVAAASWGRPLLSRLSAFRRGDDAEPSEEPDDGADAAEACRDLMRQITSELVKAMSAVNGLKAAPALQTTLYTELTAIRRSLGFTSQVRGAPGDGRDWNQIRSELILSLQGTQRIIGIADAARTSFSAHPAALEVITTRLEAYAFLGVNASASEMALKKAVNALRQCWHPDLATDEEDRRLREIRIKQINAAWDLISRKQMSTC